MEGRNLHGGNHRKERKASPAGSEENPHGRRDFDLKKRWRTLGFCKLAVRGRWKRKTRMINGIGLREERQISQELLFTENAKTDEVKATMENGVLTVTVPKQEVKKPEAKTIKITG
ncbi:unnamed protein product [Fraxinus pennsylvanica]|uniref:SHSP domain-containing protein n=1 Tax=Fraxinus pennsylvanica TaxID=56036 RepID=A0AAD2EBW2_9LAMI|nr:unnamed protein product [Fraxinus pennsylvanica]